MSETPKGKGSKVLILINNQNNFNKLIYNSFLESITSNAKVDCFVYNNNARLFSRLQEKKNLDYTDFVVIPHVVDDFQNMFTKINNLPQNKLAILQQFVNEISNDAKSSNF